VIIISADSLNQFALDVCVVPTTGIEHAEFSVRIPIRAKEGGLDMKCWAKCDQVTTLEKTDLRFSIGVLSSTTFSEIEKQVKICLGLQ
jgi:mRNA-degrading endonuclease toxin of MazEF toxin-antitoxin module